MGLSFSVPKIVKCPPSLAQMYKCLTNDKDIDFTTPTGGPGGKAHGDLTRWANQGVFLLNAILTV
jgi:uracil-DNA glycosylase